jgi:hypothetical protein
MNCDTPENPTGVNFPSFALWTGALGGGTLAPTSMQMQGPLFPTGDSGVTQVNTITLSASTTTAGDFGVALIGPILAVAMLEGGTFPVYWANNLLSTGLVRLQTDAAIGLALRMELQENESAPWAGTASSPSGFTGADTQS